MMPPRDQVLDLSCQADKTAGVRDTSGFPVYALSAFRPWMPALGLGDSQAPLHLWAWCVLEVQMRTLGPREGQELVQSHIWTRAAKILGGITHRGIQR